MCRGVRVSHSPLSRVAERAPEPLLEALRRGHTAVLRAEEAMVRPSDDKQSMLVLGTGRGGTTAVMEAAAAGWNAPAVFEPLNPSASRAARRALPEHGMPFLRAGDAAPQLRSYFARCLQGRALSHWSVRYTQAVHVFRSPRVIVKEIRANRMVGWIHEQFPDLDVVVVFKHPLNVVDSMLRAPWGWAQASWDELVPPAAEALGVAPESLCTPNDDRALWCMCVWLADTVAVLRDADPARTSFITAEALTLDPRAALRTAFAAFDEFDFAGAERSLQRPSALASGGYTLPRQPKLPTREFAPEMLDRMSSWLAEYSIDLYSLDDAMPHDSR